MTNTDLEQKIKTAVEHAAPNQLESILSSCDEQKGEINMTNTTSRRKSHFTAIAAVAAVFLLCVISIPVLQKNVFSSPVTDSVVILDVNPSLSMNVDAEGKVLSAEPLNDDAGEILGNMELEGTTLETAVNAIIGSMLQKGYLSDVQNSILVSVENDDAERSAQLQEQVSKLISSAVENNAANNSTMNAAVLSQTIMDDNAELTDLAEKYNISPGKAALIQEVIRQKPEITFESLASMTINEIALIISSNHVSAESVTQTGTASDKAYIGQEAALEKACQHAGVSSADILKQDIKLDSEHGLMVYEVEFETNDTEYEYEVNAGTGEIVNFEKENRYKEGDSSYQKTESDKNESSSQQETESGSHHDDDHDDNEHHTTSSVSCIGKNAALSTALQHAGLSESALTEKEIELDEEDGRMVYNVELKSGSKEYEYEIDAETGTILKSEIDIDD
ncbi:MAG: PepSY domain-containing protein [Lachnospiraceae bacterium]|nr:PepSY domain-containing protein [Lachnospiraceae bacterium]